MSEAEFRNRIIWTSFVLSVLVTLIHSVNLAPTNTQLEIILDTCFNSGNYREYASFSAGCEDFLSNKLGAFAVPGFFFISGYLFSRGFEAGKIKEKWKRRIRTQLVPYLFWNTLYTFFYLFLAKDLWNAGNLLNGIFLYKYNPVFWFMSQLIILSILAPLFIIISQNKKMAYLVLAVLYLLFINDREIFLNWDACIYFYSGIMAEKHFDISGSGRKGFIFILAGIFFLFFKTAYFSHFVLYPDRGILKTVFSNKAVLEMILSTPFQRSILVFSRLSLFLGCWYILPLIFRFPPPGIFSNTFLIYAIHYPIARLQIHISESFFPGNTFQERFFKLLLYFLVPVISVILSIFISFMGKYFPKLFLISGGKNYVQGR